MADLVARNSMLVRRPPAEAFRAFVDPAVLTRFWLEAASGPLAPGAEVVWDFMVPGARATVKVTAFEKPRRIAFDWPDGVQVDLRFESQGEDATKVSVETRGLQGEEALAGTTEGFAIVLCDLKILLETGRPAHLVRDKAALIAGAP